MHTVQGFVVRIAMLVVSVSLGIAVVELALRTFGPPGEAGEFRELHEPRPDRPWLYGLRPGASGVLSEVKNLVRYDINSDGFRDRLYARPKPAGVFRIVVVGDSVAFGYDVAQHEAFPDKLEVMLGDLADPAVEVVNLGIGGFNPYTELELLKDVGASFQPDLVLAQFCINDLNDPTLHFDFHSRQRLGAIPDAAFPDPTTRRDPASAAGGAERTCHRLEVCSRLYGSYLALTAVEPDDAARAAGVKALARATGPEWSWLEDRYVEMAAEARAQGSSFAVLAVPHPGQLRGEGDDPVRRRLVEMGERNGWVTIDPLPAFQRAYRRKKPLFLDWWHPTPLGHRIAARVTLQRLACAGLLPPRGAALCREVREPAATSEWGAVDASPGRAEALP